MPIKRRGKATLFTEEETLLILDYYAKGHGAWFIADKMECGVKPIYRILRENNIKIRDDIEKSTKNTYDKDYFEVVDTEDKAYWLGFIYADGYVAFPKVGSNKLGISISVKDEHHLAKFKKSIQATHKIRRYKANTCYNSQDYVRIELCGNKIVEDIGRLGVVKSKTTLLNFPTEQQVPISLLRHFIRGYLDGDGSVMINKKGYLVVSFVGTREFLEGLAEIFQVQHLKLSQRHKDRDVNNYELRITGRKAISICEWMYKDSTVFLERKFNKYEELINSTSKSAV